MFKLAALVEEHKETLATIETWDNGARRHGFSRTVYVESLALIVGRRQAIFGSAQ